MEEGRLNPMETEKNSSSTQGGTSPWLPGNNEKDWNLWDFVAFLRRKKWQTLKVGLVFFLLAFLYVLIIPPLYKSSARLVVQPENPEQARLTVGEIPVIRRMFGYDAVPNQIEFLKSRVLATRLVEREFLQIQIEDLAMPISISGRVLGFPSRMLGALSGLSARPEAGQQRRELLNKVWVSSAEIEPIPYGTTIRFRLRITQDNAFEVSGGGLKSPVRGTFGTPVHLGIAEITFQKSSFAKVGDRFRIKVVNKDRAVDRLQRSLTVTRPAQQANQIDVHLENKNPILAQKLLETLLQIYQSLNKELKARDIRETLKFIQGEINDVLVAFQKSQSALDEYQRKTGVFSVSAQAEALIKQIAELETERNKDSLIFSNLQVALNNLKAGTERLSSKLLEIPATAEIQSSDILRMLAGLVKNRESELVYKKPEHPDIVNLNEQIETLRKQALSALEADYQRTRTRLSELDASISRLKEKLLSFPEAESKIAELALEVTTHRETLAYLKKREAEANILLNSIVSDAEILDPPSEPWRPTAPNTPLLLAGGLFFGIFVGVVYQFLIFAGSGMTQQKP